jgi:hypothetical protein
MASTAASGVSTARNATSVPLGILSEPFDMLKVATTASYWSVIEEIGGEGNNDWSFDVKI